MSNIFCDKTAGPMVLIGAALALGGLFSLVRGAEIGGAVCAIGFLIEFTGPYLHDRAHRRRGEEPHAMWGEGDRNKPGWLKRH